MSTNLSQLEHQLRPEETGQEENIQQLLRPDNWEFTNPKDRLFTSDHVIDAYLKGKEEGLTGANKLILNAFNHNIRVSAELASEIISYLRSIGFHPIAAFLKINNWDDFKMLVSLPHEEFVSPNLLQIYDHLADMENRVDGEFYHLEISLLGHGEQLDSDCLDADGFIFRYRAA